MSDFSDEFSLMDPPKGETTPEKYVRLDNTPIQSRDLDTFSEDMSGQATDKYVLLAHLEKVNSKGWTQKNLKPLLSAYFSESPNEPPNWRTVVRWRNKYLKSGGDLASLVSSHKQKGNYKKRVQGDEQFFENALARFLDAKRPTVTAAYQYYKDAITIENEKIVDGKIPFISYTSFNKRIKSLPPYPAAVARHGKFKADQWFAYCSSHIPHTRILERVEIDHTPLDLILLDDEYGIPLGRPYLTLLIDVFSGCILGFHLGYQAPSYISTAKAITHAIKPKTQLDKLNIQLRNNWPCHGKIETLVVDNGAEFWSKSLEHACNEAKINIQYNPVRKPWLKPVVERFFGVINQYLLTEIPGKTFSNILAKEEYKPEKDAVMKFSTFVEEFHRWIVDVYHQDSNSRETKIPALRWQQGVDVFPPLQMSEAEEERFTKLMGLVKTRTLTRNGFKLDDLMYDSTALADYRKHYPQTKATIKKIIKVDPDDISCINVYLEELGGYLRVPCTEQSGYTEGLSLHEHKMIKAYNREYVRENKNSLGLAKARMELHDRIKQEQQDFLEYKSKSKITGIKNHAKLAGISNTGKSTIKETGGAPAFIVEPKSILEVEDIDWDDDLEAFDE